jgi:hypothetical protein
LVKFIRHAENSIISALGGRENITPQQRIIINRAAYKAARCRLFEAAAIAEDGTTHADHYYLAWTNSLRTDLLALGLNRVPRPVQDLQSYLRSKEASSND